MSNLEVEVAKIEQRSKSNTFRIDDLERKVDKLDRIYTTIATLTQKMTNVDEKVNEIKDDVANMKNAKFSNNFVEKIKTAVITAICTSVAVAIVAKILEITF